MVFRQSPLLLHAVRVIRRNILHGMTIRLRQSPSSHHYGRSMGTLVQEHEVLHVSHCL